MYLVFVALSVLLQLQVTSGHNYYFTCEAYDYLEVGMTGKKLSIFKIY